MPNDPDDDWWHQGPPVWFTFPQDSAMAPAGHLVVELECLLPTDDAPPIVAGDLVALETATKTDLNFQAAYEEWLTGPITKAANPLNLLRLDYVNAGRDVQRLIEILRSGRS